MFIEMCWLNKDPNFESIQYQGLIQDLVGGGGGGVVGMDGVLVKNLS